MDEVDFQRLRDVFARYPEVAGVGLFGSQPRAAASTRSDVDLVVRDRDDLVLRFETIKHNVVVYAVPGVGATRRWCGHVVVFEAGVAAISAAKCWSDRAPARLRAGR